MVKHRIKSVIKGRKREYKWKHIYEAKGYDVLRSAGSHGFADLVAIDTKNKKIIFIQCKPDNFPEKSKRELLEKHKELNDEFMCEFKII